MKTIILLCVLLLAIGCATTLPPQIIQLPRPKLPTSYTQTEPIPCPADQTYEGLINWSQQLKQIIEKLNQKLEAIKKWEEEGK